MKKALPYLSAALLFAAFHLNAQELKHCGTTEAMNAAMANDPSIKTRLEAIEEETQQVDQDAFQHSSQNGKLNSINQTNGTVYYIPVVFHILYQTPAENISNAQIIDQVNILNRDYRKLNADTANIVTAFKALAKDVEIEFRLATKDPNGNCTNGIIRHYDANTDWPANTTSATYAYTGSGSGKWPPSKYLNVYVVRTMGSGAAGYTYLPGTWGLNAPQDAIVILHNYVGSIGTSSAFTSRALTHEVGHWLNLQHVWGSTNQPGVACGNDGVTDTPVTKGYTSCTLTNTKICNSTIEENIQNYMEYAYCSNMFTVGQVTRMRNTVINNTGSVGRSTIVGATNLSNTGVTNPIVCSPVAEFRANKRIVCASSTVQFFDSTLNAPVTSWQWSFPGGTPSTATDSMPVITYNTPGVYAVTYTATNSSGSNSISKAGYITVVSNIATYNGAYSESFETITVPNSDWTVDNTGGGVTWTQVNTAASTGSQSMKLANFSNTPGEVDVIYSPSFDLSSIYTNNPPVSFTFKVAYQQRATTNIDKLQVFSSINCGQAWTQRYSKSGTSLSTAGTGSSAFTPTSTQWRTETVNVLPISNQANVLFKFVFTSDTSSSAPGNNIYIDDINIHGATVGIEDNTISNLLNLQVYPNPTSGTVNISFDLYEKHYTKLYITDMLGKVVENVVSSTELGAGNHQYTVGKTAMNPGIYFMNLNVDGKLFTQKIIVE